VWRIVGVVGRPTTAVGRGLPIGLAFGDLALAVGRRGDDAFGVAAGDGVTLRW
jgi:hypothetical protein